MDALDELAPVSGDYATLAMADAFDWTAAGEALGEGEWYMVVFRSVRRADADEAMLTAHDDRAHEEASRSTGFVHYFKGPLAADGTCLSFCIWASRAHARAASGQPLHAEAAGLVGEMYQRYTLEFLRLRREARGRLTFEAYDTTGRALAPAAAPSPFVTAPAFNPAPTPS